jgi:outer membrane protein
MHSGNAADRKSGHRGRRSCGAPHGVGRLINPCLAIAALTLIVGAPVARAETISEALAHAYVTSPDLSAQRANTRAIDENVPKATAGYRPTITASASDGYQFTAEQGPATHENLNSFPSSETLQVTQNIWNGNRTSNGVQQAESQVGAAREQLRLSELTLLDNAATFYMNVLRDTAILDLDRNNVEVLEEQLKQTQDRFQVGEVTRTDVANAESALATGRATVLQAQANLETDVANYREFIGEDPRDLAPARPLESMIPASLDQAIAIAMSQHPSITSAFQNVDVAEYAVKVAESALLPELGVTGTLENENDFQGVPGVHEFAGSVLAQLTVPIYDGGADDATIRQAKEQLGQARLEADLARTQIRAQLVSAWGAWQAARASIIAQESAVRAAGIALTGTREEALVGQLTTLDVLNAQQALLNARVNLVTAQHDRVVGSYNVLTAMGILSASLLRLDVVRYDPTVHYDQVKNKWFGVTTPDGR